MKNRLESGEELFLKVLEDLDLGENIFESRSREGIFTPAMTMWLMMSQRASGGRGLLAAVEDLAAGEGQKIGEMNPKSRRLRVTDISQNTSAFSQARSRLPVETVRKVTDGIANYIAKQEGQSWHGLKVYLCDGTTLCVSPTKSNLREYKPTRNQHGTCRNPEIQCLFCHELWSGTAMNVQFAPYRGPESLSEQRLCLGVLDQFPKNSLLLADRNFGIFSVAYEADRRKIQTLVRLTKCRAKKLCGASFADPNDVDIPIVWKAGVTTIPGLEIPAGATVKGRFIKHTLKRKGFRDLLLYFFTTSIESAQEIVKLYAQRERIENDIRSIKYVIGMETLRGKTPEMLEKELLFGIAAYNLVRAVVAKAAKKLNIAPRKISFSRATRLIRIFGNQLSATSDKLQHAKIVERLIKGLNQVKIANRTYYRIEPRKVVRKRQLFPLMKKSRSQERKQAKQIAIKFGHRGYFTSVTRNY